MEGRRIVVLRGNTRHSFLYSLHHGLEPAVTVQRVCGEQRGVAGACPFTGVAYTWCLDYYCVTIHLCCPIFEFNNGRGRGSRGGGGYFRGSSGFAASHIRWDF